MSTNCEYASSVGDVPTSTAGQEEGRHRGPTMSQLPTAAADVALTRGSLRRPRIARSNRTRAVEVPLLSILRVRQDRVSHRSHLPAELRHRFVTRMVRVVVMSANAQPRTLARQMLLERASLRAPRIERLVGMQAQVPIDPGGLGRGWKRRPQLADLITARRAVRASLMRDDPSGHRATYAGCVRRWTRSSSACSGRESVRPSPRRRRHRRAVSHGPRAHRGTAAHARRAPSAARRAMARSRQRCALRHRVPIARDTGAATRGMGQGRTGHVDDRRVVARSAARSRPIHRGRGPAVPRRIRTGGGDGRQAWCD